MITKSNYLQTITDFGVDNLPKTLLDSHEFIKEVTNDFTDWSLCEEEPDIKETTKIYFEKLSKFIGSHTKEKGREKKSGPAKNGNGVGPKYRDSNFQNPGRTANEKIHNKPTHSETNTHHVEHIEEEIRFIKRFVGLHNRNKSRNAILNFIKALQKSIVQKLIRKTSKYAKEILYIQKTLVDAFNNAKGDISIMIHQDNLPGFVAIAGGEQVFSSIGIIKRFIGMEGKPLEAQKRVNFITFIDNAIKKGKLKDDPYEDKVKLIQKELKKSKSEKTAISIGHEELSGFKGIVNGCGCNGVSTSNHKKHNGLSGIMTAEEIVNQQYEMLPFYGKWRELIGQPAVNFTLMLHGEPGSGKTSFMMQFAKYLHSLGKVLYISSEEYGSPTLQDKVKTYLTPLPQNVHFAPTMLNEDLSSYGFVVLDSITDLNLSLEDFKALKEMYPNTAFIILVQHTKNGQFRGSKEWEHEVQIVGEVSQGMIKITKNRYGALGAMSFFD